MTRSSSLLASSRLAIEPSNRVSAIILCLAVFEIALIAATAALWTDGSSFPQVPLLSGFALPAWCGIIPLVVLAAFLAVAGLRRTDSSKLASGFAITALAAAVLLVISNQHRLQAWHWLFMLNLTWRVWLPRDEQLHLMRHTVITVYVCSALSRITFDPTHGMTAVIVQQLLSFLHLSSVDTGDGLFAVLCHVMTFGEFAVGLLLWSPRLRTIGCIGAILLHLTLLLAVGPFGLNHHTGVLLWNTCFLFLVPTLFWGRDVLESLTSAAPSVRQRIAISFVWLFPISGLFGIADNWPSWQLYSSRPETWILWIHESDRQHVPESLTSFLTAPAPLEEWSAVKLDRWSLAETSSPIYPEDRFQAAVIRDVLSQLPDDVSFRIEISEPVFPQWWRRRQREITTLEELDAELSKFILGSTSRRAHK